MDIAFALTFALVLGAPLAVALARSRGVSAAGYGFNGADTGLGATVCSVVCSNVGAGTFVAILLFSQASPLIGLAIAVSYTMGLLLCAVLAPRVHTVSRACGAYSLVDLIAVHHRAGARETVAIWLPVAFVFVLRSAVQMTALVLILTDLTGLSAPLALLVGSGAVAGYTLIGGYKAATETDTTQAIGIVLLMSVAAFGLLGRGAGLGAGPGVLDGAGSGFFDLGPYKPLLLVGIVLFIPSSPVLAIDNWQRMATARSPETARFGFLIAACVCGPIYAVIWLAGLDGRSLGLDALGAFRGLMPAGAPWLADLLFLLCIVSSIDTFVMPLVSSLARFEWGVSHLRAATALVFLAIAGLSWTMGDVLDGVIAAFSTLLVFLPATVGALVSRPRPIARAAYASMNAGLVTTLAVMPFDDGIASFAGFLVSLGIYLALRRRRTARPA